MRLPTKNHHVTRGVCFACGTSSEDQQALEAARRAQTDLLLCPFVYLFPHAEEDKKALEAATAELKPLTDYMQKVGLLV